MANTRKSDREKSSSPSSPLLSLRPILLLSPFAFLLLLYLSVRYVPTKVRLTTATPPKIPSQQPLNRQAFDCRKSPQASPVFASLVEGVPRPFFYSIADVGTLPDRPNGEILRIVQGKRFSAPEISLPLQTVLQGREMKTDAVVVDVGGNVGMATFAAVAMGFRVLAFEPVFENLQRLCDGIYLNRAWDMVTLFPYAASERSGSIIFHKLVGRLDNSAVSAEGAKMTFTENEEVEMKVETVRVDEVVGKQKVVLIKIDVQGWELHVLRGAEKVLAREKGEAPYVIYEEDDRLLKASNTTAMEIRGFMTGLGYHCERREGDAHCTKE